MISGMLFSCSNDDDDLNAYLSDSQVYGTGGEDGQTIPPLKQILPINP